MLVLLQNKHKHTPAHLSTHQLTSANPTAHLSTTQRTAAHLNTPQLTSTHLSSPQHTSAHLNTSHHTPSHPSTPKPTLYSRFSSNVLAFCNTVNIFGITFDATHQFLCTNNTHINKLSFIDDFTTLRNSAVNTVSLKGFNALGLQSTILEPTHKHLIISRLSQCDCFIINIQIYPMAIP